MSFKEKINESIEEKIYESLFNLQEKRKMDPVGKADADIDNDGDVDDSDEYLHNRRKAIKKAMTKEDLDDFGDLIDSLDEEQLDEISKELARRAVAQGIARSDRHWDKHGFTKHGAWLDTKSNKAARHLAKRHGEKEVSKAVKDSQKL